jgi:hypothetical protein
MKTLLKICLFGLFFPSLLFSQQDIDKLLDYTLSYRGLTRSDITIPIDFFSAAEKSPTNDSKLLLPLVRNMMITPLNSMKWLDTIMEYKELPVDKLLYLLFHDIDFYKQDITFNLETHVIITDFSHTLYEYPNNVDQLLSLIEQRVKLANEHERNLLKVYSKGDLIFLQENLLSIIEESDKDDPANFDIFKFNEERDSSNMISKHSMDLLSKLDKNLIFKYSMDDFLFCYGLYNHLYKNKEQLIKQIGTDVIESEVDGKKIAIGGIGNNVYEGDYAFIIDFGGDDVYKINKNENYPPFTKGGQGGFGNNFSCIIDLSGNDYYTSKDNATLGGSVFASSFIFDKEGDDTYIGKNISLGASIGGIGLIYDESGNDTYHGVSFCIGAGCFGIGAVVDRSGNDFYIANSYGEGFGMTQGIGVIVDNTGNDSYLVDARSLDIGRYEDHYISMCQGFGLGLRPYYAGGIGLLIDGEGNDVYHTDIFGQGAAYWYSLGALVDKSGNDHYTSYQYSQGAGIHLAIGLLKDYDGWDFYSSDGVSQGCGHDFGFGLLWDVKGNDNYSAYSLSQGAGNANGIGIFIDESGTDGYLVKDPRNTRGYGNPRREYGSIGIFIDASGDDYYSQPGYDSTIANSSMWGVSNDYFEKDKPEQISGNNFKVPMDESNPHLIVDNMIGPINSYFTMAKTLEPRFSLWADYGLNKLVEDSVAASNYILTKLSTDDARETNLMRILSHKIQYSLASSLKIALDEYISDKSKMEPSAVSFACYLFGETQNPLAKETLLKLTYDDNIRVRSSALNALGKINIDNSDIDFKNRVSQRLIEIVNENQGYKLFNKDLAFAFKNYYNENNIPSLEKLLSYDFFGVRFLAADALKDYWKTDVTIPANAGISKIAFQAFLMSLTNVMDEVFIKIYDYLINNADMNDEIIRMNILDLLKQREKKSSNEFKEFYNLKIKTLQESVTLKVR